MKGYRLPEGAVSVTRPGRWGNPWRVGDLLCSPEEARYLPCIVGESPSVLHNAGQAVTAFRAYAAARMRAEPEWLAPLRGKDLACFCAPGAVCHADVLLELANR